MAVGGSVCSLVFMIFTWGTGRTEKLWYVSGAILTEAVFLYPYSITSSKVMRMSMRMGSLPLAVHSSIDLTKLCAEAHCLRFLVWLRVEEISVSYGACWEDHQIHLINSYNNKLAISLQCHLAFSSSGEQVVWQEYLEREKLLGKY